MKEIQIRFFGNLADLPEPALRERTIHIAFHGLRSVKDLIESFNVPHTEIAFIQINGTFVDFSHPLDNCDDVCVYPLSYEEEFEEAQPLVMITPRIIAFVCDVHLWKLARYLRLLGFDTAFDKTKDDPALAIQSRDQKRILLTRDRKLLMRNMVWGGLLIRSMDSVEQVKEVIRRFRLKERVLPFSRCSVCNHILHSIKKKNDHFAAIERRIPEGVRDSHDTFSICSECGAIYWQGTHYKRLQATFKNILK